MNIKTKIAVGMSMAVFMAAVTVPGGAFAKVKIANNGSDSVNKVTIKNTKKTMVMQSNNSMVMNKVGIMQNTGENSISGSTGSSVVSIGTGNATATVTNNTTTGGNVLVMDECGCQPTDPNTIITGNGKDSTNSITVSSCDSTYVGQMNEAWVFNQVGVGQNTGMNRVSGTTSSSDGDPSITTGNTKVTVENNTTTGENVYGPAMVY